jgi:hypothetical protein
MNLDEGTNLNLNLFFLLHLFFNLAYLVFHPLFSPVELPKGKDLSVYFLSSEVLLLLATTHKCLDTNPLVLFQLRLTLESFKLAFQD